MALITDDTSGYGAALSKDFYRQRLYNNVPGVNLTLANYQNFRNEYVLHDLMAQNTAGRELKGIVDAVAKPKHACYQDISVIAPVLKQAEPRLTRLQQRKTAGMQDVSSCN